MPTIDGDGFTKTKIPNPRQEHARRDGKDYDVLVFRTAITPSKAGKITIGPSAVIYQAQVPRAQRNRSRSRSLLDDFFGDDLFNDPFFAQRQRLTTKAAAVEIDVKPLPTAGRPESFSGAVGQFKMTAEGTPQTVQLGDPVAMQLTITGRGNFDRVNAPQLLDPSGWHAYPAKENWRPDDELGMSGTKSFEIAIVPETKKIEMPRFEFTYFDPVAEEYVTLNSERTPLVVEGNAPPPPPQRAPAVVTAPNPQAPPTPAATPQPTDIVGLRYDLGKSGSFEPIYRTIGFLVAQAVPAVALLGCSCGGGSGKMRSRKELRSSAGEKLSSGRSFALLGTHESSTTARCASCKWRRRSPAGGRKRRWTQKVSAIPAISILRQAWPLKRSCMPERSWFMPARAAVRNASKRPSEHAFWVRWNDSRRLMRALNAVFLLVIWVLTRSAGAASFEEANRLFEAGKFADARTQYQELVESGTRNANVFYNLGNTHFRLGSVGPAILSYERALALDPAHPEARANLTLVRGQSGGRVAERTWADRLILPATLNRFAVLAAVSFWAGAILLAWLLLRKRGSALGWMALFLTWSIAVYCCAAAWHLRGNESLAIVLAKEADARLAPADRAGLAEKLPAGSRVRVLSERGAWTYCELPGQGRGWLPTDALERVYLPSA
jgi:hypothetical protein